MTARAESLAVRGYSCPGSGLLRGRCDWPLAYPEPRVGRRPVSQGSRVLWDPVDLARALCKRVAA